MGVNLTAIRLALVLGIAVWALAAIWLIRRPQGLFVILLNLAVLSVLIFGMPLAFPRLFNAFSIPYWMNFTPLLYGFPLAVMAGFIRFSKEPRERSILPISLLGTAAGLLFCGLFWKFLQV